MPYIAQAILSAAGVFAAMWVARDSAAFPIYQFGISLVMIILACLIVLYGPRLFRK